MTASTSTISPIGAGRSTRGLDRWLLRVPANPGNVPFAPSIGSIRNFRPAKSTTSVAFRTCVIFMGMAPRLGYRVGPGDTWPPHALFRGQDRHGGVHTSKVVLMQ